MKYLKIVFSLFLIICFLSCDLDDGISPNNNQSDFSKNFGNQISRTFLGHIIDSNKLPIKDVIVNIGNETALTDRNGMFIIRDANVNERFGYIRAKKAGYIDGSRSIVPSKGTNKIEIMLLEANPVSTISSSAPETVSLPNGSSVSFNGNFIKEDGSPYSGSVDVIMHYLNPLDENMLMQMPGMLYAENQNGAERMLQTLGMLAVELRGSGGEDLNLAIGSVSEIKIPVDTSLMSIAPATIPLWYFDEVNGYWKEEGQATLEGNMYVGTVSHFSFWNCDIPTPTVTLCVNVTYEGGILLSNIEVEIISSNYGATTGTTDENGEVCGLIPRYEPLELNVYSNELCDGTPIHTQSIGSFNNNGDVTIIVPNDPNIITETVTGNFVTCDGDPVTNGYVQLTYDNLTTYGSETITTMINDGSFEMTVLRCEENDNFKINGRDYNNSQRTGSINYTFTSPTTNIGVLQACNSATEFVEINLDGVDYYSRDNTDSITTYLNTQYDDVDIFQITSWVTDGNGSLWSPVLVGVLDKNDYIGSYESFTDFPNDIGFFIHYSYMQIQNNNMTYNVVSFGEVGDYIDINFNGAYEDNDGIMHTINGIMHVLRDE